MSLQLRDVGGSDIVNWQRPLLELYTQVYAEPPWLETPLEAATFAERLEDHAQRQGFRCEIVLEDGRLLGACYGFPAGCSSLPDTRFYRALASGLDSAVVREHLLGDVCEIPELMVVGTARRRGVGRALIGRRLRGERRAWLCTHPAGPGLPFYLATGWTVRGQFAGPSGKPLVVCTWAAGQD